MIVRCRPDHYSSYRNSWSKTGYNPDIDIGTEHIWGVGGTFAFPPSAMQMEVISGSADDAGAGTGVQQVIITYLDSSYLEKTEIVTLNGATAVPTVATNILRINNFRAYRVGTGKVAAGLISIRETDDSPTYSGILAGMTRARNSAYTVPINRHLFITSATFSSIGTTAGMDTLFTARCSYDDKRGAIIDFLMPFIECGVQDGTFYRIFEEPIYIPPTADITVTGTAGNNNTICSSILRGRLELKAC